MPLGSALGADHVRVVATLVVSAAEAWIGSIAMIAHAMGSQETRRRQRGGTGDLLGRNLRLVYPAPCEANAVSPPASQLPAKGPSPCTSRNVSVAGYLYVTRVMLF